MFPHPNLTAGYVDDRRVRFERAAARRRLFVGRRAITPAAVPTTSHTHARPVAAERSRKPLPAGTPAGADRRAA